MEQQPQFLKQFSKQESQPERDQLAQEIREKRKNYFDVKKGIETQETEKTETLKEIKTLRDTIEAYNDESFFVKIKDFLAIKKVQAQLQGKLGQQSSVEEDISQAIAGRPDLDETRQMLSDFYATERKKWAEVPYAKEDIVANFTEEHLASLSTENYVTLLQRFPSEMVTHVTRQGVRDHAELNNHQAGLGEYHSGFTTVLQKKELRSALGIAMQEKAKEDAIAQFLKLDECPSRNAALGRLSVHFNSAIIGDPNAFADHAAVHVASESVADAFYGSERGNEIFFAIPTAHIASQHSFDDSDQNDQYIWTDLDKGLSLNAGIVFVPEDAEVSPKNGSQYELDANERPLPSRELNEILSARFGDRAGFVQVFFQKLPQYLADYPGADIETLLQDPHIQGLFRDYSIKSEIAKRALLDRKLVESLDGSWGTDGEKENYTAILQKYFQVHGVAPYARAQGAISSKEYWEQHFTEHPELRPKHVVYYSGGNPTLALQEWKKRNGLLKKGKLSNIGFQENSVSKNDRNEDKEKQRFVAIANQLIDKRFPVAEGEPLSYSYDWNS